MSFQFTCPGGNVAVAVNPTTSTVCLKGTVLQTKPLLATTIVVQVVTGPSTSAPATIPASGTTSATPTGASWCATGVPVPTFSVSPPGRQLTAYAWQQDGTGSVQASCAQPFLGLTASASGATDCCSGCSGAQHLLAAELRSAKELLVTVPDGENAGHYRATMLNPGLWLVSIRGTVYRISQSPSGMRLVGQGATPVDIAGTVSYEPFSATFAGHVLGAKGDIVVIVA